ncbi:GMC family oxidoreductase [Kitasatospora sp. NPDC097643]|uniref:GMC family oxidoreductase n=1 Tax=Kitasatospora sp. NPDC097643 TaxID=3157230 RepID=UPI00331F4B41
MAGLAVADEWERRGGSGALVLEAGPGDDLTHYRASHDESEALEIWLDPESDPSFWRPWSTSGSAYSGISALRRRLGGRSLYWHGVSLPIEDWALRDGSWPPAVVRDLTRSWDGGDSLYDRVTAELTQWAAAGGRQSLDAGPGLRLGPYAFTPTPQAVRSEPGQETRWAAYSPLAGWRDPAGGLLHRPGVELITSCLALGVLVEDDAAVGVRVRRHGATKDIRAHRVVLAAGSVENARLAIQALTEGGRLAEPELPGLRDKIAHGFTVSFDLGELPPEVAQAARRGSFLYSPAPERLRSNLFLSLRLNAFGSAALDVWIMGEQSADASGLVRCTPTPQWPWPVAVEATPSREDLALATAQQTELQTVWDSLSGLLDRPASALKFDREYGSPDLPRRLLSVQNARAASGPITYSFPLGSEQHDAGTTPFGSLLDDGHQFTAVPGLFAAGPSSFARTGAANPSLTTLALAKRLGAILAASSPAPAAAASAG